MMSIAGDLFETIARVAAAFDEIGAPWAIGGSFSSSLYGEPRSTNDIDFVAVLRTEQAREFVSALGPTFYGDSEVALDAIRRSTSFNVIDNETIVKVDVFVPAPGPMGRGQLDRRQRVTLTPELDVWVLGPEDTILQKLRWYEIGGSISERQWRDICEVLRVQADRLDIHYLQVTATAAGLESLLVRAIADVRGG
jgi:hypothetical protein